MTNLTLPGNPRYQPKELQPFFGYDNLFKPVAEVEIATMRTLAEIGVIPLGEIALLTPEIEQALLAITTTEVDEVERKMTKHDIRAWVRIAQGLVDRRLGRWLHILLTSYDALDTARALQFTRAHREVVRKLADKVISLLAERVRFFISQKQIGRTHGQHALPITVGFWLATILSRVLGCVEKASAAADGLVGKISGAVGAHNAQIALGIEARCGEKSFEERVLEKLGLKPARISTQILPPEPLADYLFSCVLLSAALGQFGRDGSNLMRTEIGELCEPFAADQVGSSTMAHKRNPITFENLESTWLKTKNEFGNVLDVLISDHQRDLVNSAISRDFPTIVVNLVLQLNTLLRGDPPFISRVSVDPVACQHNLAMQSGLIIAEPLYIALQIAGYAGDAHELVNRRAMPIAQAKGVNLFGAVQVMASDDKDVAKALAQIPKETRDILWQSEDYIGDAERKASEIATAAEVYLAPRAS